RCHDHKFDGFRQSDYYRMQAFFAPVQPLDLVKASKEEQAEWKTKAAPVETEIAALTKEIAKRTKENLPTTELQTRLDETQERMPPALPSLFTVKDDFAQKTPIHVLPRGDYEHPGDAVGMRMPGVLLEDGAPELPEETSKPREVLSRWLTDAQNPLTAR